MDEAAQPRDARWRGLLPGWLRDYERTWLVWDVIAGLIVWSVVVPQAVGT